MHPRCNASKVCFFVYFNREGKLAAKEYFDNEWKVSHDIFEGENINKLLKMRAVSANDREDSCVSVNLKRYLGCLECLPWVSASPVHPLNVV